MGDNTEQKLADSSVDKLYEIFSEMVRQQQLKTAPESYKYTLEPNPIKLVGPGNYISWARHAQLILSSHGYESLISDKEKVEGCETSNRQLNDKVLVWMLGSMESTVREQVETMTTVCEVWTTLEKQFAGKSNKMQATRIMHELNDLKQGTKSVTEYAGEMKKLYRDLHFYHPFEPIEKKDLVIHHKWFESFVGKLFLDGLNPEFDLRRQLIYSKPEWPSLDDIVSSVMEDETRLAHEKGDSQRGIDARAALSMQNTYAYDKNKWSCDYCKKKGHTKDKCFKLHGYPPGWQKGKFRIGGAHDSKWNQANHTTSIGQVSPVDAQALEEFKSKLKLLESSSSSLGSSKVESNFHETSQGMDTHQAYTSTTQPKPWIIDTGATNHMTGARDRETSWDWDHA